MPNIFEEPKELKKWAIKLANACGGQKVEKTLIMTKVNFSFYCNFTSSVS